MLGLFPPKSKICSKRKEALERPLEREGTSMVTGAGRVTLGISGVTRRYSRLLEETSDLVPEVGNHGLAALEQIVRGFSGSYSHCRFSGKLRKRVYDLVPTVCWSNRDTRSARTWYNGIPSNQSNPCVCRHAQPRKFLLLFFYAARANCVLPRSDAREFMSHTLAGCGMPMTINGM